MSPEYIKLTAHVFELTKQIEMLKEALETIADGTKWDNVCCGCHMTNMCLDLSTKEEPYKVGVDIIEFAQNALEGKK